MLFFATVISVVACPLASVHAVGICDASTAAASSMIQRTSGIGGASLSDLDSHEQSQQHEVERQSAIVKGLVERRLIALATVVKEGLDPADATELCHTFASTFDPTTVDLSVGTLPENMHESIQRIAGPLTDMVCHIRSGDCQSEFHDFLHKILTGLMTSVQALFQKTPSAPEPELLQQGQADPVLLELYEKSFIGLMRGNVKQGESADSAVQQAKDVLAKMKTSCDSALPDYVQMGKTKLAHEYFRTMIRTFCLPTTNSCETLLTKLIEELAIQAEAQPGSFMQIGMRAAVKVAMKLYGVSDLATESAVERAAAIKAYLEMRVVAAASAAARTT